MSTLLLSYQDLQQLVRRVGIDRFMDELIERLTSALSAFDPEETEIPLRAGFHYERPVTGLIEWMPLLKRQDSVLMKVVGYHPNSPLTLQMPTILSVFSKYDPATGHLEAVVDGTFMTAVRTGAASAVASRVLAKSGSRRLGLIGCGAQAVTQLHALSRTFEFEKVLIHDSDPTAMQSFPARVAAFVDRRTGVHEASLERVVGESDILCVATSIGIGEGPVFGELPRLPWLHVNAVGSDFPGKVELPVTLLRESLVCADTLEQARKEGECQQLVPDEIGPDLVELVRGHERYASFRDQPTVFDSTGWALQDHVALELMLGYAAEYALGSTIQIESMTRDPKDPYEFLDAADETASRLGTAS